MPRLFLAPAMAGQAQKKPVGLVFLCVDGSGSMLTKDAAGLTRSDYVRRQVVRFMETNYKIKNAEILTSVIWFGDHAQIILPPSAKHDLNVRAGAIEALTARRDQITN